MSVMENVIAERYRTRALQPARLPRLGRRAQLRRGRSSPTTTSNARRPTRASGCSRAATCRSSSSAARSIPSPSVILANQPTRGLDVGAVAYVHGKLLEARDRGAAILLISEDLEEVLALSDRVVVISRGRLSTPSARGERSVRELGELMAGGRRWRREDRSELALSHPPRLPDISPSRGEINRVAVTEFSAAVAQRWSVISPLRGRWPAGQRGAAALAPSRRLQRRRRPMRLEPSPPRRCGDAALPAGRGRRHAASSPRCWCWPPAPRPSPSSTSSSRAPPARSSPLLETLTRATPLIFTGLAVAVAFRARLWNIGAEAQLYVGGVVTVVLGTGALPLPSYPAHPGHHDRRHGRPARCCCSARRS